MKNNFVLCFSILLLSCLTDLSAQQSGINDVTDLFRIRQSASYIPDISNGSGVAFRDINGDGLPDIYITALYGNNYLLLNSGAYRPFKDITPIAALYGNPRPDGVYNFESGQTVLDKKIGATLVDIDNDADADVVLTGWGISTALFLNQGQFTFKNITDHLDIYPPLQTNACISADINNDRFLDLFMTDEFRRNHLLLNSGDGFFMDIAGQSGINRKAGSRSASFCDVDLDGDQDLYICRHQAPDLFYHNQGDGRFELLSLSMKTLQDSLNTTSVSFADIDNDGDFDLFVTLLSGRDFLYINTSTQADSQWQFIDQSANYFQNHSDASIGHVISDFNNDGFLDIYVTTNGQNVLYLNNRLNTFKRLTETDQAQSRGVACADFDLDGDIDIFIANEDSSSLFFMNALNNPNSVMLKPIGIRSNRDAIGTRVEIYPTGKTANRQNLLAMREVSGASGYFSQNEPVVHFGLDTLQFVDALIYFPSGTIREEYDLKAGNTYIIYEDDIFSRTIILFIQHLRYLMGQAEFWYQVFLILLFFALIFFLVRMGAIRYKWNAATASGYLIGFFLMALIAIIALKKLGLVYILAIINMLTIVFVAIFIVNSERLYRLRRIRERYRRVLIDLNNKIINIHNDQQLFETVIDNIALHTEFDRVAVFPFVQRDNSFLEPVCRQLAVTSKDIQTGIDLSEFVSLILEQRYLLEKDNKDFEVLFNLLSSKILIAIERNSNLMGILSLGTTKDISPLKEEDIDLFVSLANQMAITIENNEYILRSTEMIKKLTEAEVREQYLNELEKTNAELDLKNQDLQKLYNELKNTQSQLIHSEKMASLGQLVAGISHELNNPIGFIYANVKQLKSYTEKIESLSRAFTDLSKRSPESRVKDGKVLATILPDLQNLIEDTVRGSQSVKNLVDNLRRFSHLDQAQWKEFDIHQGLESSLMILNPELKHRIKVEKHFRTSKKIECNPGQINQVLLNILSNAAQAIQGKGKITIETSDDAENVYIKISDSGSGIPDKIVNKIFDPFFTTKEVGKGTGLGLSISYSIIKNHNGKIEVKTSEGQGTTFRIVLPITDRDGATERK